MRLKSLIGIILWGGMLVACGPDNRVALAEKLMAERETDSAITVMNEIKEPLHNLSKRDYALYALLMSEAVHRKQQLNACCCRQLNISANRAILFMPNGPFTAKHIWTDGLTG